MNLYVMRHGTTIWNEKKITQGRSNNRLSKSGIELVKQRSIEYKDVKFDLIISSPLFRTIQTANIMNKYHNVKIIKDERIIEIDQGIFTGRAHSSLSDEEKLLKEKRSKECGMESIEEVYLRAKKFLDYIKREYKDKTILVVTHDVVCCALISIEKNDYDYFENNPYAFTNAKVKKLI